MIVIYALSDPQTPENFRYVGKTTNLKSRLRGHRRDCDKHPNTHKNRWLRSIDFRPRVTILTVTDRLHWVEDETYWILRLRSLGYSLTNATEGGEGTFGWCPSEETRDRLRQARSKQVFTAETRAKIGNSQLGRVFTEETRMKMRAAAQRRKAKK